MELEPRIQSTIGFRLPIGSRGGSAGRMTNTTELPGGTRSAVGLLVTGQAASTIGDACYAVAVPWYILASSDGLSTLSTTLACYGTARAAAMPIGGALCDRLGARRVLL